MMNFIKGAIASHKNPFTETDGSWCIKRIVSTVAAIEMLYKFASTATPDYQSFSIGIAAISAGLAMVNFAERGDKRPEGEEDHASNS